MSIINIKTKYYGKRVWGLKSYAYFWSWLVVAVDVLMLVYMVTNWTDDLMVPFMSYCVHCVWAFSGALSIPLCDKLAFIVNIPLLIWNCIISLYIQTLAVTDTPLRTASDYLHGMRNLSTANLVIYGVESISHDIVFFMSAAVLVMFILNRGFFMADLKIMKAQSSVGQDDYDD